MDGGIASLRAKTQGGFGIAVRQASLHVAGCRRLLRGTTAEPIRQGVCGGCGGHVHRGKRLHAAWRATGFAGIGEAKSSDWPERLMSFTPLEGYGRLNQVIHEGGCCDGRCTNAPSKHGCRFRLYPLANVQEESESSANQHRDPACGSRTRDVADEVRLLL